MSTSPLTHVTGLECALLDDPISFHDFSSPRPTAQLTCGRSDEVKLHGGLSQNGRPAELVRMKNGQAISITTGRPVEDTEMDESGAIKHYISDDDESAARSMARRKRSVSASELAPKRCCEVGCMKEFKRPCDLTKHEKTHSRPWKCAEVDCKYHEYGWPTEKERDRHVNDKHSSAPAQHKCQFPPCPYRSKRESNCKQHMEKAHGWVYKRSKNNGKNKGKNKGALAAPAQPATQMPEMATPQSSAGDVTPEDDGEFERTTSDPDYNNSVAYAQNTYGEPMNDCPIYTSYEEDLNFYGLLQNNAELQVDYSRGQPSLRYSTDSSNSPFLSDATGSFVGALDVPLDFIPFPAAQAHQMDFVMCSEDLYSAEDTLPTPFRSIEQQPRQSFDPLDADISVRGNGAPHISPHGQGNTMLFTPSTVYDELDGDFMEFQAQPNINNDHFQGQRPLDFTLFETAALDMAPGGVRAANLFGEIPGSVEDYDMGPTSTQDILQNLFPSNDRMEWRQ